ncbi:hypothetical protein AB1Y20_010082 [Prymnesium parvum]|uniref:histone acetyltransferase n=1 Tax=Prymnesium parvum TaxID=97485 RepID=A0AB34K3D5_PRYPA
MSSLGFVSVDELANEIEKHHDSDLLRTQITDLRAKKIDLKKFCSNVRMMCGAQVLLDTVKGLQSKQKEKQAAKAAAAAPNGLTHRPATTPLVAPPPTEQKAFPSVVPHVAPPFVGSAPLEPSPRTMAMPPPAEPPAHERARVPVPPNGGEVARPVAMDKQLSHSDANHSGLQEGSKTLVHALLCSRDGCEISGCRTTKTLLGRVKEHASSCAFANLPGGQSDCTTCKKWHQLERLKEHYRRKLISIAKQQVAQGKIPLQMFRPRVEAEPSSSHVASPSIGASHDPLGASSAIMAAQEKARKAALEAKASASSAGSSISLLQQLRPATASSCSSTPPTPFTTVAPPLPAPEHDPFAAAPKLQSYTPMALPTPHPRPLPQLAPEKVPKLESPAPPLPPAPIAPRPPVAKAESSDTLESFAPFWKTLQDQGADDEMDSLEALLDKEFEEKDRRLGITRSDDGAPPAKAAKYSHPPSIVTTGFPPRGMGKPMPAAMYGKGPSSAGHSKPAPGGAKASKPAAEKGKKPRGKGKEGPPTSPLPDSPALSLAGSVGSALDVEHLEEEARENKYMQLIDEGADMPLLRDEGVADEWLSPGMHVVIDLARLPYATTTISTATRPHPTNVAVVKALHQDGTCDAQMVCNCGADGEARPCEGCEPGRLVRGVQPHQRQIACSTCMHVDLAFALPQLRCSNCEKQIKNGNNYYRDRDLSRRIKLCQGCFSDLAAGIRLTALAELSDDLEKHSFDKVMWQAKEQEDYDHYVQCEGDCRRWYHYICAFYPDPSQLLTRDKTLEAQKFICKHCRKDAFGLTISNDKVLKLQQRKARDLPVCALSQAIEEFMHEDLKRQQVVAADLVVRLVSNKSYLYQVMGEMKARYDDYPDSLPYQSKLLLAFQTIQGHDVLCFAMYVQEYGSHCPQPNTNRTYISYLDSVPYMVTTPPGARTAVYHGIINGYLKHACALGFEHAHIWVAPPQSGDEYIFHSRPLHPKHGHKPMSMQKLRSWYESLLCKAKSAGIVSEMSDIHEAVEHLTSVREFPLFYGDFFPEEMQKLLKEEAVQATAKPTVGPPQLKRHSSIGLVKQMQKRAREVRRRFLVARLNSDGTPKIHTDEAEFYATNDLVDSRLAFLETCITRHWQFNELRRAHYSTMMILAEIGGPAL